MSLKRGRWAALLMVVAVVMVFAAGALPAAADSGPVLTSSNTRNWQWHKYDYSCNEFYPGGTLDSGMMGEHHFVYVGWTYEVRWGDRWVPTYSWVYPSGQIGPAKITGKWEYWDDSPNPWVSWCPRR